MYFIKMINFRLTGTYYLPMATCSVRASPIVSVGKSSMEVIMGRKPVFPHIEVMYADAQ